MSVKIAVAAPFKHMRKDRLQRSEFVFYIAIDRKWMNKEQANQLLERAKAEGLIEMDSGIIRPLFDVAEVSIPLGFKPTSDILVTKSPYEEMIGRITAATGKSPQEVVAELHQVVDHFDGNLLVEAAVVVLAKKYGVPFEDKLDSLEREILKKR
ncbi:MAG TPA: DUF2240 family protein [Candidatus Methanoculleus thermohydrogenotrophicum]|nr:DUF2240 family protein [Candidatus Methanoculleus thermohydrogenotrophicum]HOB18640.1 DUF2240 family protein [Candidatus Methanoculleus thermohydrogenotrophicum]HPZ38725.1 DUF2240 family protein [Candidatus Methanoculleus thermohydrogenotrophicum]HQC91898.1 DUF2240 family protein [Candidatus Methanoculleus thermohydrogenotrophicum]